MVGHKSWKNILYRSRFQLLPCVAGLILGVISCLTVGQQLYEIRKSDRMKGALLISHENLQVTQELLDYVAGLDGAARAVPVLYADAEFGVGVYQLSATVTGLDLEVLDLEDMPDITLYQETSRPEILLTSAVFETLTTVDGGTPTTSERALLKERIAGGTVQMQTGEAEPVQAGVAGVLEQQEDDTPTVYMELTHLRRYLNKAGEDAAVNRVLVQLERRDAAPAIAEIMQAQGYETTYSFAEELEEHEQNRDELLRRLRLLIILLFFVFLCGGYIIQKEI